MRDWIRRRFVGSGTVCGWGSAVETRVERLGRDVCRGQETTPHRHPATERTVVDGEPGC